MAEDRHLTLITPRAVGKHATIWAVCDGDASGAGRSVIDRIASAWAAAYAFVAAAGRVLDSGTIRCRP